MIAGAGSEEEEVGWVLVDVYTGRLPGLEDKLVCLFKLVVNMVRGGIWELVCNADEKQSGGIWCG
jgi:hypothetical protein